MRIRSEQIGRITARIMRDLVSGGLLNTEREEDLAAGLARAFEDNLKAEDALDNEVHEIMRAHAAEMRQGNIEHHEMFRMIKQKLAKEKKFPL